MFILLKITKQKAIQTSKQMYRCLNVLSLLYQIFDFCDLNYQKVFSNKISHGNSTPSPPHSPEVAWAPKPPSSWRLCELPIPLEYTSHPILQNGVFWRFWLALKFFLRPRSQSPILLHSNGFSPCWWSETLKRHCSGWSAPMCTYLGRRIRKHCWSYHLCSSYWTSLIALV